MIDFLNTFGAQDVFVRNLHALAGTLALTKHTNDFDTDTDWEQTKKRLSSQILTTIN
jgi:hypothetical protein